MYADKKLLDRFTAEYPKYTDAKLDIGESCIRFKKPEKIPFQLIEKLATKITPKPWIQIYEHEFKR